ncbi:MAG: thiamine phosphate synthase, partial [Wenzhouxiangellaceae bacterium]
MKPNPLTLRPGLYAIPPATLTGRALLDAAAAALAGGAVCLQYRAKPCADIETARALRELCRRRGATFIVNDDPRTAREADADGVHLGRDDAALDAARELLGSDRIIGVSCYDDFERARRLAARGADYLAFGSVAASPTKPTAPRCPLEHLGRA